VLTKPEHVTKWFAPYEEKVTVCSIDLRVGGDYHIVFVTYDGRECSFRGTYLEVEPRGAVLRHTLASGSDDGTTRLWNPNVQYAIDRICAAAGGLTPQQWTEYIRELRYQATCVH
jgi:uncharacterized protein YndB with AHSA1/START domain